MSKYNRIINVTFFILVSCSLFWIISRYSYPLFHMLIEFTIIIISIMFFVIAVISKKFGQNSLLINLAPGILVASIITFVHAIAYKGMNLLPGYDSNLPTQLWVVLNYILSISILIALLHGDKKIKFWPLTILYSFVGFVLSILCFIGLFPDAFLSSTGLTPFKIISEYIIIGILLVGIVILFIKKDKYSRENFTAMLVCLILFIVSEYVFTLFYDLFSMSNFIGHYIRLVAFVTIFNSILIIGIETPYKDVVYEKNEFAILSITDSLTGLYNRLYYENVITGELLNKNPVFALIMADVNGLKLTNEAFGHKQGDILLKKVASILKSEASGDTFIARIGGDEFVLLVPKATPNEINELIFRIHSAAETESIPPYILSVSIGVCMKENESITMEEAFKLAEDSMYRNKILESMSFRSQLINVIMNSLFEKSNRELMHSERVSELCYAIASQMDFSKEEIKRIKTAGLMHDIGKIGITENILNKPGKLTKEEQIEIMRHSEIGYSILSSCNEFSELAQFVLNHHEKWDGSGYPNGLKCEATQLEARIISVADAYDAMTSERSYRKALSKKEAIKELTRCSGTQFDPDVVKVFVNQVLLKSAQ